MHFLDLLLLCAELGLYFAVMTALFRMRHRFGMGIFVTALGLMHFLETYLAGTVYVQVPLGTASPGSVILFSGKLILLLIVYIREDATAVRQPIFGLLFGNLLTIALVLLLRRHAFVPVAPGVWPDVSFLDGMGGLMLWGTLLLFIDSILIILLYEKLGRWLSGHTTVRICASALIVLSFDQLGFFIGLNVLFGVPIEALFGGWLAKMAAAVLYGVLAGAYLRWFDAKPAVKPDGHRLADIFDALTYRERYEALLEQSGRDGLTGLFHRGRFDTHGRLAAEQAIADGSALSVLVIDVDHFKSVNDIHGHAIGDAVLRHIAGQIAAMIRETDAVFRYGGEEFVVLSPGLSHDAAVRLGQRICREVSMASPPGMSRTITVSVGVATAPLDGRNLDDLFACADARLYAAKSDGRDKVMGASPAPKRRPGEERATGRAGPERAVPERIGAMLEPGR